MPPPTTKKLGIVLLLQVGQIRLSLAQRSETWKGVSRKTFLCMFRTYLHYLAGEIVEYVVLVLLRAARYSDMQAYRVLSVTQ